MKLVDRSELEYQFESARILGTRALCLGGEPLKLQRGQKAAAIAHSTLIAVPRSVHKGSEILRRVFDDVPSARASAMRRTAVEWSHRCGPTAVCAVAMRLQALTLNAAAPPLRRPHANRYHICNRAEPTDHAIRPAEASVLI